MNEIAPEAGLNLNTPHDIGLSLYLAIEQD
jgi:hypothetical protein